MGDRREQMTIVGPGFCLARLESGRGANGVAGSQGNVGGGERISMAVLSNSDSVTGTRFVPLHHPNAPRAFGSASAYFTPMSSLLTSFCGRLRPCRRRLGQREAELSQKAKTGGSWPCWLVRTPDAN